MQLYLDLRKVLPKLSNPKLAEEIGITISELKHLLHTEATTVNQAHLTKVCNYLRAKELVHESDLPGILYSKQYDSFWPMLSERRRVELLTGVRKGDADWTEVVSAADSMLQFNVQYRLTEDGNQSRQTKNMALRRVIDARLIKSWDFDGHNHSQVQKDANKTYKIFDKETSDRGLVLFGSVKSNPVVCPSIANVFNGAKPFVSEDHVKKPNDRSCPFMFLYRDDDPHPPSCCGGLQLSTSQPGQGPGIYYQVELGQPWECIPSSTTCDAALVFYRFDHAEGNRLEMTLGGFSGRATRSLAKYLRNEDAGIFAPTYQEDGLDVGVFIVKFDYSKSQSNDHTGNQSAELAAQRPRAEVIPLAKEVLFDRVKPAKRNRKRAKSTRRTSR